MQQRNLAKIASTVFLLLSAIAGYREANAATLFCDGCTSTGEATKAESVLAGSSTPLTELVYVVNRTTGTARKFTVQRTWPAGYNSQACNVIRDEIPAYCLPVITTTEYAVESEIATFVALVKTYNDDEIALPAGQIFPRNAYEAVQYPDLSSNVGTYIKDGGIGFVKDFLDFLSIVNPFSGFSPGGINLTVRVKFEDGGYALFVYNQTTKTFERVKGHAVDASGNVVPEGVEDVAGGNIGNTREYVFANDPESLSEFLMRMSMLGVPITGPVSGKVVCTSRIANGRVSVYCKFI